ncbi:hypothetical protein BC829DRAFT_463543 [Chytridium lagenaria]|nr:hypothetical protein BC829DRAFT_463543 [Chytridium lagenaria]
MLCPLNPLLQRSLQSPPLLLPSKPQPVPPRQPKSNPTKASHPNCPRTHKTFPPRRSHINQNPSSKPKPIQTHPRTTFPDTPPQSSPTSPSLNRNHCQRHPEPTPTPTVTHKGSSTACSDSRALSGVTSTPLWRRGLNDDVLCNAWVILETASCQSAKTLRPTSKKDTEGLPSVECHNCMTKNTPLWRRDDEGRPSATLAVSIINSTTNHGPFP